jgi:hypothetical protein
VIKGPLWSFLKGFLRNRSSDNIESNTKTSCTENETNVAKEDGLWCLTPLSTIHRSVLLV